MSDKLREAALMAVDALDSDDPTIQMRAALNLRAALAEPAIKDSLTVAEQEPVAFVDLGSLKFISHTPDTTVGVSKYRTPFKNSPLYTAPPRREWVGLTAEDINQFETWFDDEEERKGWVDPALIAKYFEAKLREKNDV